MTKLSVNINKIATLRNARGGNVPDVIKAAIDCEKFGAQGITVHPRPDERHIKKQDVYELKKVITTEFNIEGYPGNDFIKMVLIVKPEQVTLVPDAPEQQTSNHGWNTRPHKTFLTDVIKEFKSNGIRTSIFIDPDIKNIECSAEIGTDRIELYTEPYATLYPVDKEKAIDPFIKAAHVAKELGLCLNAGHDLSLVNLNYLYKKIPWIMEVSIGHALVSDALYLGLENTIRAYLNCLE